MTGGRIFINYRRDDSRADSGRLYDRLSAHFPGKVFRDVASLEPGVEWHDAIARVIGQSDACIIVIGRDWLSITNANGERRLNDPRDTVRQEIVAALERKMRVFPVLVGGAKMPTEEELPPDLHSLCRRNALEITEQDWDEDLRKLVSALETALGITQQRPEVTNQAKPFSSGGRWVFVGVGGLAALLVMGLLLNVVMRKPVVVVAPNPTATQVPSQGGDARNAGSPASASDADRKSSRAPEPTAGSTPTNSPASRPRRVDQALHASESVRLGDSAASVPPPPRAAVSSVELVGTWHAVVTAQSRRLDEMVGIYQDHSFVVTLQGEVAAVGNWQYDSASGSLRISDAVNFLANGTKFDCSYKSNEGGLSGECVDRMRNSWGVLLSREAGELPPVPYSIPRLDISSLTMAEKVAFGMALAAARCTCPCGYTVLLCLEKDQTCPYSPTLASNMLMAFLRLMGS
jgi:TIR domain